MTDTDRRVLAAFPPPPRETYSRELSRVCGFMVVSTRHLWPLERDGWLASRWEDADVAAADRRLYRLTNAGLRRRYEGRVGEPGAGRLALDGAS